MSIYFKKAVLFRKITSSFIGLIFTCSIFVPSVSAEYILGLPKPGEMVSLSTQFEPAILKGLTIHPENPLAFNFIVDRGEGVLSDESFKQEADNLIKYFLAAMAIPEDKSWVNLSPYEKDRIIPDLLAQTQMGKQMLEQDYLLKQLSASLTNPDQELGKKFWDAVYKRTFELYGKTEVPISTFNKIWIVPQKAVVLEKDGHAYISESHLKVMMAEEYETIQKNAVIASKVSPLGTNEAKQSLPNEIASSPGSLHAPRNDMGNISSQIFRETILPAIEKEVNEGKNFAPVRQIYNSVILATWYKISLKETLLTKVYADKGKIKGVDIPEKDVKQKVYDQYLEAFRRGVYNIIKEDYDVAAKDVLPRKYFSGGLTTASSGVIKIIKTNEFPVGSSPAVTRLATVGGVLVEKPGEKSFYTTLTPEKKAALEPPELFKPLESKNKLTMSFEDGEVTLAYDQPNDTTYLVQITNHKLITQMMIPGKLTDTSVIFFAFNSAQDLRNWLNKNSALSLKLSIDQQGLFHSVLAKALLVVDEDIDFSRNPQIRNILGLMEYLVGPEAVSEVNAAMNRATPAERQRILDKALSEALVANPDFIFNAAQLLGLESENPQLTVEKLMPGGTIISSYNPETDLSIFIISRPFDRSVYFVRGNMAPMLELSDIFETADKLDAFLSAIKTIKNTGSGYEFQSKGYILDAEYLFALAKYKQTRQSDPKIAKVLPQVEEESFDLLEPSFFKRSVSRLTAFRQQLLELPKSLSGKIFSGVMGFLKRHTLSSVSVRPVGKADGVIQVSYDPKADKTTFAIRPSDSRKSIFSESRHVFAGNLTSLPIDNETLTASEIQTLMKIAQTNGFSRQRRAELLTALFAAQMLAVREFEISPDREVRPKVREIVEKINSNNSILISRMYLAMQIARTDFDRKRIFVETFLYLLFEDVEHQAAIDAKLKPLSSDVSREPQIDADLAAVSSISSNDSSVSVDLPDGKIKITQRRGLFQIDIISQDKLVKNYFVVLPGFDVETLAQKISKVNKLKGQSITVEEFQRLLNLANDSRFDIFGRGLIFQTLLAAAEFSNKQLEKVEEILKKDTESIKTAIPKIARAFRVNFTSLARPDGTMEIFYNPFNRRSLATIEYINVSGKSEKNEYVLEGDWVNYPLDSYRSVKEIQTQMAAVAQSQGLSAIQQQNLLRIVDAARTIKLSEFHGNNSLRIMRILKLKSENGQKLDKAAREFLVFDIRTAKPRERQGYFVEFLASQLSLHPQFFREVAQELGVDLLEDKRTPDAVASSSTDVGGIDFNPTLLDLQIKRDGRGIALPLPQQNLEQINIEGLYPVILNIQPVLMQDFPFVVSDRKSQPQIDLAVKK